MTEHNFIIRIAEIVSRFGLNADEAFYLDAYCRDNASDADNVWATAIATADMYAQDPAWLRQVVTNYQATEDAMTRSLTLKERQDKAAKASKHRAKFREQLDQAVKNEIRLAKAAVDNGTVPAPRPVHLRRGTNTLTEDALDN